MGTAVKRNPEIILSATQGLHNASTVQTLERLERQKTYQDLSTVCVVPTRGEIPARVVESWMGLMTPMNQKYVRMFISGMEVGAAYSAAVEAIFGNELLKDFKYMFTLEEDNTVPPDGLLKLYESIGRFDAVSGLYFTKGPGGVAMAYGDTSKPMNFIPQLPKPDTVQRVYGIGMGFSLWKLSMFKDKKLDKPYFQTVQTFDPTAGTEGYSQDLHACERFGKLGYKFGVDTRIRVGHYDHTGTAGPPGIVW